MGSNVARRTKDQALIMPRGMYKGKPIHLIPSKYIKFVAENWSEETPEDKELVEACDAEWSWREQNDWHIGEEE